ncbi:MAG: type VI secretion system-associated protein TagF [Desulfobacteraceae bacterium]|nr:type VI secretion system-associated protein TagF [Desulfobacteraceae bacterium]
MFGIGKSNKKWSWVAYGKHPSIKDYLTVGKESPLFSALSKWMENGFRALSRGEVVNNGISWRFIATSANDRMVSGVMKSSYDSMNRSFPLLVMGDGYLENWTNNWSYMPFACEKIWAAAEHITTVKADNIKELGKLIRRIGEPEANYDGFKSQMVKLGNMDLCAFDSGFNKAFTDKLNNIDGLLRNNELLLSLGGGGVDSLMSLVSVTKFLKAIKNRTSKLPVMVFWGGTDQKSWIYLLKRPLKQEDFRIIWTIGNREL